MRATKNLTRVASVLAAATALTGCAARETVISGDGGRQTEVTRPVRQETMGVDNEIIVEGKNRGAVRLLAVKTSRPNGYLRLQIGLQNVTNDDQEVLYEVHFFDGDGYPIPETSGWIPLAITAHGVQYGSVTCIKREAQTFKVHMMYK